MSTVKPQGRFGVVNLSGDKVTDFLEKPDGDGGWVNGGFFVLDKKVINFIKDEKTIWEKHTLTMLAKKNQIRSYQHDGFWYSMDTIRDKEYLEDQWKKKKCPWKKWNE